MMTLAMLLPTPEWQAYASVGHQLAQLLAAVTLGTLGLVLISRP